MPTQRTPRSGSMQYRPRKRAARLHPRIRTHVLPEDAKIAGFAGYKVGMTHIMVKDNRRKSMSSEDVSFPVTVIECPPLRVIGIKAYKLTESGAQPAYEIAVKGSKELARKLSTPKTDKSAKIADIEKDDAVTDVRLHVQTQPTLAGFGKKTPEIFEVAIGGADVKAKLAYAKQVLGHDVTVQDVLAEGQFIDVYGVTSGHGFQGPVKRFGVAIRSHKSEKTKRGPGNLGPWTGNRSWTVPHAGQTGLHSRKERNKWLIRISEKAEDVNPQGGFLRYGNVRSTYILVKGSIAGPAKRLVRLAQPARPSPKYSTEAPQVSRVSLASKQ